MAGNELKNCQPKTGETFEKCQPKPVRCGCGGEASCYFTHYWGKCFTVQCFECGIETKPYDTEAEAITAWNRAMSGNTKAKLKAFWDGMSAEMREERKKEKWQRRKSSDCWECSKCHAVLESDDIVRHNFYYCYHCGADMMNEDGYMKLEGTEHE